MAPRFGSGLVWLLIACAPPASRAAAPASVEQEVLEARDPEDRGSCFEHALADLDGDGKDEVLVLDRGPAWCGTGGCTVTIYARGARGLAEVASIPLVDRLSLGQGRTNGWRDLVVRNRYGAWLLVFDGKAYPDNPTVPPAKKVPPPDPAAGKLAWTKATTCR